jgi:DNA repair photolyase
MGGDTPKLKSCFKDEKHALKVFEKELQANLPELQKHGLFFSFTTDPMLKETINLTIDSIAICVSNNVPIKILTKRTEFVEDLVGYAGTRFEWDNARNFLAIGFTLTGHDELEPNANPNAERIEAMRKLHEAGFKTWASIEPVIDFETSRIMIKMCIERNNDCCNLFKIGLMSGEKYEQKEVKRFVNMVLINAEISKTKIYFKDSLLKQAGIKREDLPSSCVNRDYNMLSNN